MNVIYGRVRLGLSAVMVAGAFLLALVPFTAAQAAATTFHFKFTGDPVSFTDDSCGFPVAVNLQDTGVGTVHFDAQGNFQSLIVETNTVGTNSANGITLRVNSNSVDIFNSAGYDKETGLPIHIQDGGLVIRDAGYLLLNPDGSVALIHGPHPQLEGDIAAVCAALS